VSQGWLEVIGGLHGVRWASGLREPSSTLLTGGRCIFHDRLPLFSSDLLLFFSVLT